MVPLSYSDALVLPFFVYGTLKHGRSNHKSYFPPEVVADIVEAKTIAEKFRLYTTTKMGFPAVVEVYPLSQVQGMVPETGTQIKGEIIHIKENAPYPDILKEVDSLEQGYVRTQVLVVPEPTTILPGAEPPPAILAWMYLAAPHWTLTIKKDWIWEKTGEWPPPLSAIVQEMLS